jgi:hypothetical protein
MFLKKKRKKSDYLPALLSVMKNKEKNKRMLKYEVDGTQTQVTPRQTAARKTTLMSLWMRKKKSE